VRARAQAIKGPEDTLDQANAKQEALEDAIDRCDKIDYAVGFHSYANGLFPTVTAPCCLPGPSLALLSAPSDPRTAPETPTPDRKTDRPAGNVGARGRASHSSRAHCACRQGQSSLPGCPSGAFALCLSLSQRLSSRCRSRETHNPAGSAGRAFFFLVAPHPKRLPVRTLSGHSVPDFCSRSVTSLLSRHG